MSNFGAGQIEDYGHNTDEEHEFYSYTQGLLDIELSETLNFDYNFADKEEVISKAEIEYFNMFEYLSNIFSPNLANW
ncbi:hypothetical protein N9043_00395 [bacterium]|nr:hypothetical protein [bacterium]